MSIFLRIFIPFYEMISSTALHFFQTNVFFIKFHFAYILRIKKYSNKRKITYLSKQYWFLEDSFKNWKSFLRSCKFRILPIELNNIKKWKQTKSIDFFTNLTYCLGKTNIYIFLLYHQIVTKRCGIYRSTLKCVDFSNMHTMFYIGVVYI